MGRGVKQEHRQTPDAARCALDSFESAYPSLTGFPGVLPLQCCVCPVAGGALKPTNMRGLWCHSACMQWIPEVGSCLPVCSEEPV